MAGPLTTEEIHADDLTACLDLVAHVYGRRPSHETLPPDLLLVRQDRRIVGFVALYCHPEIAAGAVDWLALAEGLEPALKESILSALMDGLRGLKKRRGLRTVVVHTPYPEMRAQVRAADAQPGETDCRRLVARTGV